MRTKIIGLTGGIGSGKTTIAHYFMSWGVPVYFADDEAKKILYSADAAREVSDAFGQDAFTDGIPDMQKIAAIVFNNPDKLKVLNSIIHPKVRQHFTDWVAGHKDVPFVIKEAAILFESGSYKDCDSIIVVTAPQEVRVKRVMKRDNTTEDKVLERMGNQWDEARKVAMGTYVIDNTNKDEARKQAFNVFEIIQKAIDQI